MKPKDKLSQYKYIYNLYVSSDEVLHIEKYPIVYINNTYVYYVHNGSDELQKKYLSYLLLQITQKDIDYLWKYRKSSCFKSFLELDNEMVEEMFEKAKNRIAVSKEEEALKKLKEKFETAEKNYNKAKHEYAVALEVQKMRAAKEKINDKVKQDAQLQN